MKKRLKKLYPTQMKTQHLLLNNSEIIVRLVYFLRSNDRPSFFEKVQSRHSKFLSISKETVISWLLIPHLPHLLLAISSSQKGRIQRQTCLYQTDKYQSLLCMCKPPALGKALKCEHAAVTSHTLIQSIRPPIIYALIRSMLYHKNP